MRSFFCALILLCLLVPLQTACAAIPRPTLSPVPFDEVADEVLFDQEIWQRRQDILSGIEDNLNYLRTPRADIAYTDFDKSGISKEHVRRSLLRFKQLLLTCRTPSELREHLQSEFVLYRPLGNDGFGTVRFTGYFQPAYKASLTRTAEFKYPIYSLPKNFQAWDKPHPSRVYLEGFNGLGNSNSPLAGHEIAFLRNRWEAFMIHVQGSAILELQDGEQVAVGFAGGTDYPFHGISKRFMLEHAISWTELPEYFSKHPEELDACLARNNRFIFFQINENALPIGSLGVPVIAERSMATDKRFLPPGALGLIHARIPITGRDGNLRMEHTSRFVLDQDAGSAIKGSGRVDLFMGTGPDAQRKASHVYADGQLYYLLLK